MWSLLSLRLQVLVVVVCTILVVQAIEALLELSGSGATHPLRYASLAASVIGVILVPVANVVWRGVWRRFPAIERATFPDLNGTWEGHIFSTWVSPDTGTVPEPIPVTVRITQSLFSTTVRFQTHEAMSRSTWCTLEAHRAAGAYRVLYAYEHEPTAGVRPRNPSHRGFTRLEMDIDAERDRLGGQYFTERKTTGDIKLRRAPPGS